MGLFGEYYSTTGIIPQPPIDQYNMVAIPGYPPATMPMVPGVPTTMQAPAPTTVPVSQMSPIQARIALENEWKLRPLYQVLLEELFGLYPNPLSSLYPKSRFREGYLVVREFYKDPKFELEHEKMSADLKKWEAYSPPSDLFSAQQSILNERLPLSNEVSKQKTLKSDAQKYLNTTTQGIVPAPYLMSLFPGGQAQAQSVIANADKIIYEYGLRVTDLTNKLNAIYDAQAAHYNNYIKDLMPKDEIYQRYQEILIDIAKAHPQAILKAMKLDIARAINERDEKIAALAEEKKAEIQTERNEFIEFLKKEADLYINYGNLRENMKMLADEITEKRRRIQADIDWLNNEGEWLKSEGPAIQAYAEAEAHSIEEDAGMFSMFDTQIRANKLKADISTRQFKLEQRANQYQTNAKVFDANKTKIAAENAEDEKKYRILQDIHAERMNHVRSPAFMRSTLALYNDRKKFGITHAGIERFIPAYFAEVSYLFRSAEDLWDFKNLRGKWGFLRYNIQDYTAKAGDIEKAIRDDIRRFKENHPEAFKSEVFQDMLQSARAQGVIPMTDAQYKQQSVEFKVQVADSALQDRLRKYEIVMDRAEKELLQDAGSQEIDVNALTPEKKRIFYNLSMRLVNDLAPYIEKLIKEHRELRSKILSGEANEVETALYEQARRMILQYTEAQNLIKKLYDFIMEEKRIQAGIEESA